MDQQRVGAVTGQERLVVGDEPAAADQNQPCGWLLAPLPADRGCVGHRDRSPVVLVAGCPRADQDHVGEGSQRVEDRAVTGGPQRPGPTVDREGAIDAHDHVRHHPRTISGDRPVVVGQ